MKLFLGENKPVTFKEGGASKKSGKDKKVFWNVYLEKLRGR